MNTEQFIRNAAARGLSRRATRLALGIGPWVFREMLTLMPDIEWPARGCSADHQRANEQKRGRCTPLKPLHWSSGDANPGSFQSEGTDKTSPNNHPTVKPTELMGYLVRLVTPAGGLTIDPYMGSGSTGKAAILKGYRFVGIEREAPFLPIAEARISHAFAKREAATAQSDLFGGL